MRDGHGGKEREGELLQKLPDQPDPDSREARLQINRLLRSEPKVWSFLTDKANALC